MGIYILNYMKNTIFNSEKGFTLVELLTVIAILGILISVAIPRFGKIIDEARLSKTKEEMQNLRIAIIGNSSALSGSQYTSIGYEGDIGQLPNQSQDLVANPGLPLYDKFTRKGWNGPYIKSDGNDYLYDAWGNLYIYNKSGRTITSYGSDGVSGGLSYAADIVVNF